MAMTTTASGLSYEDTRVGTGATPMKGQTCSMHYTGWLWENGKKGAASDWSRRLVGPGTARYALGSQLGKK